MNFKKIEKQISRICLNFGQLADDDDDDDDEDEDDDDDDEK